MVRCASLFSQEGSGKDIGSKAGIYKAEIPGALWPICQKTVKIGPFKGPC